MNRILDLSSVFLKQFDILMEIYDFLKLFEGKTYTEEEYQSTLRYLKSLPRNIGKARFLINMTSSKMIDNKKIWKNV